MTWPIRERVVETLTKHPDYDDETIAKQVLAKIKTRADIAEMTQPLVAELVRSVRRNATRNAERRVFEGGTVDDPTGELRDLLDRSIQLDDGRLVAWGDATVDDHRARIAYLQRLADGIERTIAVHRLAIATISAAEAACLRDLDDDQIAPLIEALR